MYPSTPITSCEATHKKAHNPPCSMLYSPLGQSKYNIIIHKMIMTIVKRLKPTLKSVAVMVLLPHGDVEYDRDS
jgi:hypothetical protein